MSCDRKDVKRTGLERKGGEIKRKGQIDSFKDPFEWLREDSRRAPSPRSSLSL